MHDANPLDAPSADPFAIAREAADQIADLTGVEHHDIALTLGSGWGKAAELIGETTHTIAATDVPGFSKPAVEGHVGTLRS
ncbi:MAG TPA: purine-nucleoside phosphorylase, partial [Agromyces sp.]